MSIDNKTHVEHWQVVEVISAAIGDMMQAEFTALRDSHGNAVLPPNAVTMSDWEQQTFLASGSLISHSCKAALMLAEHSDMLQQQAYEFGKQITLACQVCLYSFLIPVIFFYKLCKNAYTIDTSFL